MRFKETSLIRQNATKSTNMFAVGYARVSTDEQAIEGQSLDNQESRIRAYSDSQGWELAEIYREEGQSGKSLDRPELSRMITDLKLERFGIVLVYKVDRLTRRQKDLWFLLEDVFERHQVGFKSVLEPFDTTTAQGKAFLGMLAVFAQLERDTVAERTKDILRNKRVKGEWVGRVPFGFKLNGGGLLEIDQEQQEIISRIKRLRRDGRSLRGIAGRCDMSYTTILNILNDGRKRRNPIYYNGFQHQTV
jgi:site-specific DNA recombinase